MRLTEKRLRKEQPMTIEVSLLLSAISVAFAIFFGISSKKRGETKDVREESEEKAATSTMMMIKLENIANDLKEIKSENRSVREDIISLRERVATVESSLKSYHKRLDGTGNTSDR